MEEAAEAAPAKDVRAESEQAADAEDPESDEEKLKFGKQKDPLYDPEMDKKDEEWMTQRRKRSQKNGRTTDGFLSCPACFASLCSDCQQHEAYKSQFRAMFVENCKVCTNEQVRPTQGDSDPDLKYWNVRCVDCDTHVAVVDSDEVYHFFNVLCEQ